MSEYFIRLGMSEDMRMQIEAWRIGQLQVIGKIPSFSEAARQLIEKGLFDGKDKD